MPRDRVGGSRPFAGEVEDLKSSKHESTRGVIGFLGFLPGVQNALGVSFPTVSKQSKSYSNDMQKERAAGGSPHRDDRDKWGNLAVRPTPQLQHTQPDSAGASSPANQAARAQSSSSPSQHNSPSSCHHPVDASAPPKALSGYMGHRPGVRANYGVTYNREISAL